MDFTSIRFGKADAHSEGENFPKLLKEGYLDIDSVVDQALNTSTFLFLGYKGSGKSSLSEHLRLILGDDIVDQQGLKDFPFKVFDRLLTTEDRALRYKSTWRWLLCVKVFQNLYKDMESVIQSKDDLNKVFEIFTQAGILPLSTISSLVKRSSTTEASVKIRELSFVHSTQKNSDAAIDFEFATDYLKQLLLSFKEEKQHIIVIDDLDDILSPNGVQFGILTALINEVKDLNLFFSRSSVPVKILVLCRTDMFERFPDPNKNKIKQDSSYTFTWYREGIDSHKESDLINLINIRARLVYPGIHDVFDSFFPPKFQGVPTRKSLLNYTRHTPRDFIQLMNHIQSNCHPGTELVDSEEIAKGVNDYSTEYFKQEIADEMAGYFTHEVINDIFSVLSSLRSKEFRLTDFTNKAQYRLALKNVPHDSIMKVLYDCSAIGHIFHKGSNHKDYLFKYRTRSSSFDPEAWIYIHPGLWKVLGIGR